MRRKLFRHLLNVVTVLSLLVCVAVAVLWVRSYRGGGEGAEHFSLRGNWQTVPPPERHRNTRPPRYQALPPAASIVWRFAESSEGRLTVAWHREAYAAGDDVSPARVDAWVWHPSLRRDRPSLPTGSRTLSVYRADFRHWHLLLMAGALPLLRLPGLWRRLRRPRAGACPNCGYDLRATPDRCPECGQTPATTSP